MKHVMVDLETLGNGSHSAILSIGAVQFDETGTGEQFYTRVDAESCVATGMKMDVSTVLWWFKQGEAARREVADGGVDIRNALEDLATWWPAKATFWGNGATFDNVIVANAYQRLGIARPWGYTSDRCYRTMKAMFPTIKADQMDGVAHNALADALYQAKHMVKIMGAMK
jgi:hypothetical protein